MEGFLYMQSSLPWIESTRLSRNSKNKQIVPDTSLHEQDSNTLFILHGNEEDKEQFLTQESQKLIPDTRPTISQRQRKVQQNCDITTPPKHSRERPIKNCVVN